MIKKVFKKFLSLQRINLKQFVSRDKKSHEEREKKALNKIEDFWVDVDKKLADKKNLEKEIENKYKYNQVCIGNNIHGSDLVDIYFVPLIKEDQILLDLFSDKAIEEIKIGGRLVLMKEIENYNKNYPGKGVKMDFEPMSNEDIDYIKNYFYEIYEDDKSFRFALQQGKPFLNALKEHREYSVNYYKKFLNHLKYISNYSKLNNKPFNTNIKTDFQKFEDPHYVRIFLNKNKIDEEEINYNLKKIYYNYYNTLVDVYNNLDSDDNTLYSKLYKYVDSSLIERSKVFLDYMKFENYSFNISKDDIDEYSIVFDKLLVKGVFQDRNKNMEANDYVLIDSHEDKGIRYYMHKFFTGYANRYAGEKDFLTTYREAKDKEYNYIVSSKIKEGNRNFILRVSLFIKHPYKINIIKDDKNILDYTAYQYKHLAVFENELIPPHHTYLINNDFENWLSKHKLDQSRWKLVDIDNFMKGNSFFKEPNSFINFTEDTLENSFGEFMLNKFPALNLEDIQVNEVIKSETKDNKGKKQQSQEKKKIKKEGLDLNLSYRITHLTKKISSEYDKINEIDDKMFEKIYEPFSKDRTDLITSFLNILENTIKNNTKFDKETLDKLAKLYTDDVLENLKPQNKNQKFRELPNPTDNNAKGSAMDKLISQNLYKNVMKYLETKDESLLI